MSHSEHTPEWGFDTALILYYRYCNGRLSTRVQECRIAQYGTSLPEECQLIVLLYRFMITLRVGIEGKKGTFVYMVFAARIRPPSIAPIPVVIRSAAGI